MRSPQIYKSNGHWNCHHLMEWGNSATATFHITIGFGPTPRSAYESWRAGEPATGKQRAALDQLDHYRELILRGEMDL